MSSFKSSLIKYFVGMLLIIAALWIALFYFIPETNDPVNKIARMSKMFLVFLLAGIGFYFARKSAKEFARKEYENKPFEFESLELGKPYRVLSMRKLKSYTLFLLGPVTIKPKDIDYTSHVTYLRMWNEYLPKDIEQDSIICREKHDKIYVKIEDAKKN